MAWQQRLSGGRYRIPVTLRSNSGCLLFFTAALSRPQTDFEVPCAAQFVSGCPVDVCRIPPAPPDGTYQSPNRPYPDLYRDHGGLQPLEYQGLF